MASVRAPVQKKDSKFKDLQRLRRGVAHARLVRDWGWEKTGGWFRCTPQVRISSNAGYYLHRQLSAMGFLANHVYHVINTIISLRLGIDLSVAFPHQLLKPFQTNRNKLETHRNHISGQLNHVKFQLLMLELKASSPAMFGDLDPKSIKLHPTP